MSSSAYDQILDRCFQDNWAVNQATLQHVRPRLHRAAHAMVEALRAGHKLLFLGNGGSAADAQHLAAEFLGRFQRERRPLPALALHANASALTAIANDYGYEHTFLRPLQALAQPGDVVIGISTSGNSRNVLAALAWARQLPTVTIGLTGAQGGLLRDSVDILLDVASRETPRIQECHILIGHVLCEIVEHDLFA